MDRHRPLWLTKDWIIDGIDRFEHRAANPSYSAKAEPMLFTFNKVIYTHLVMVIRDRMLILMFVNPSKN